jgi:hypothetical protein
MSRGSQTATACHSSALRKPLCWILATAGAGAAGDVDLEAADGRNREVGDAEREIQADRRNPADPPAFEVLTGEEAGREQQPANGPEDATVEIGELLPDLARHLPEARIQLGIFLPARRKEGSIQARATVVTRRSRGGGVAHRVSRGCVILQPRWPVLATTALSSP